MTRAIIGFAVCAAAFMEAGAQTKSACTLRGRDTVLVSGETVKECLDLAGLSGKTVAIPANVTRIDNTGFSLCESSETTGGLTDITYVMDQSGSMGINYVWISPDKTDTVWLESTAGCRNISNADTRGFGSITIPNDAGTRTVPILNPAKDTAGCNSPSGDPYTQRGIAYKEAIDFQAARAPNSTASFIGFAARVIGTVHPLKLNDPANVNRIKAAIVPSLNDGTNYRDALDSAKKWALNPALSPNPSKAIIFVSDGKPYGPNANTYPLVLDSNYAITPGVMPPIYGIFLGQPTPDTANLRDMSVRTGGQFFRIPPDHPDSLKAVVAKILNVILRQYEPNQTTVTNLSTTPPQAGVAGPGSFVRQSDGSWLISMDRQVGLVPQAPNTIDLNSVMKETNTGTLKPTDINFILSTTGPDESINRNLPGTPFSVVCQDLPPDVDKVKVAYIKDTDGDGAADLVVFVFSRPLTALPASIDTVYWNQALPAFANKAPPKLSFLVGSGNTTVLADFSASPFPQGLTSIPAGAVPVGVLPAGGVFGGQRPPIQDSIGPIIVGATVKPFDNAGATPGSDLNIDTLVINASEGMVTDNTWNNLILWGKPVNGQCNDYAHAMPLVPFSQPSQDPSLSTFTILVQTGTGTPTPLTDDCVYLNVNGTYTDLNRNVPPIHGVALQGRRPPREIELFRGYPPVVGLTADQPGFLVINNDPRNGDNYDYSTQNAQGQYVTQWIPPVGYVPGQPFQSLIPPVATPPSGVDASGITPMPTDISTIQVVSTGKYIATVNIYDNHGVFVRRFQQAFGYWGELNNSNRISNRGLVSYLVWDLKDHRGQKAGQGVYIWKVVFQFETNKEEIQYTRTGVLRKPLATVKTP